MLCSRIAFGSLRVGLGFRLWGLLWGSGFRVSGFRLGASGLLAVEDLHDVVLVFKVIITSIHELQ